MTCRPGPRQTEAEARFAAYRCVPDAPAPVSSPTPTITPEVVAYFDTVNLRRWRSQRAPTGAFCALKRSDESIVEHLRNRHLEIEQHTLHCIDHRWRTAEVKILASWVATCLETPARHLVDEATLAIPGIRAS